MEIIDKNMDMKKIGTLIRKSRKKAKLSRNEVFTKYHIPVSTLEKWERGVRRCPIYVAEMLIDKFAQEYKNTNKR